MFQGFEVSWCKTAAKAAGGLVRRNRRRLATLAVALAACFVAYHAVFGANGMVVYQQKKAEYKTLQQRREELQKENDRLAQQNHALKNDPAAIEREARQNLRYTRPGEVVFVAPQAEQQTNPQQPVAAQK
jgi:cell division protein FtsB